MSQAKNGGMGAVIGLGASMIAKVIKGSGLTREVAELFKTVFAGCLSGVSGG